MTTITSRALRWAPLERLYAVMQEASHHRRGLGVPWTVWAPLLVMLMATATILMMVLWVVYPRDVIRLNKVPLEIWGDNVAEPGGTIEVVIDYCKETDSFGWVGGSFASRGVTYPIAAVWPQTLPKGCHVIHEVIPVPAYVRPGSYKFYMSQEYLPTVVFPQRLRVETEAFDVKVSP